MGDGQRIPEPQGGPYRTREPDMIDVTEIRLAKVREDGATKRHALELRAKASQDRRDKLAEAWRQSEFALPMTLFIPVLTAAVSTVLYLIHLWGRP